MGSDKKMAFIDYVQEHERAWGKDDYAARPSLGDVLQAPVVVFWTMEATDKRHRITLYNDLEELEDYFSKLLFRSSVDPPKQRVYRIFEKSIEMRVKGVRVIFEPAND